jgi:hypothetical protein
MIDDWRKILLWKEKYKQVEENRLEDARVLVYTVRIK